MFAIAAFLALAMAAAWGIAETSGRSGRVDSIWSFATGAACLGALALGANRPTRVAIGAAYLAVWSLRLGFYLWKRAEHGEDRRYAALRAEWAGGAPVRMFLFLQIQALAAWPLVLSAYVATASPRPAPDARDALAALVFLAALGGEALADLEMAAFRANPANKRGICENGLWGWSRHPNYFFEWIGWLGWPLLAIDAGYAAGWLALLAPAWMYYLLVHVSGLPPLEQAMRRSRGAAFDDYVRRVNAFWPAPPRSR